MIMKKKKKKKGSIQTKMIGAAAAAAAIGAGILITRSRNMQKEDSQLWDGVSKVYGMKAAVNRKTYDKMIELIKLELAPDMKVLEIASATGEIAREIAPECGHIIASDFSEAMLERARSKGTPDNLMWDLQDASCLTYTNESFDVVIIVDAMHVMPFPKEVLDQAKRVLKPDGVLIAPNHVTKGDIADTVKDGAKEMLGMGSYNEWGYDEYLDLIKSNGWNIVHDELIEGMMPTAYVVAEKDE